jgi:hypothetical protein
MNPLTHQQCLRQRAEYTHKHNLKSGRHGWVRLTPAYSLKVVEEFIAQCDRPMRIFDPFSGTATTALSASYNGHEAVTMDINPFLVWLGQAKTARYSSKTLSLTTAACTHAIDLVERKRINPALPPSIHAIERWWKPAALSFLCSLYAAIDAVASKGSPQHTLLLVSFCRTLMTLSNVAFSHQSLSLKSEDQLALPLHIDMASVFLKDVAFVLSGAADNPQRQAQVMLGDSRNPSQIASGVFDLVITSPPYANRMSYISRLRKKGSFLGNFAT